MPFTGSHPAAVVPLLRTRLPGSALVIGSMIPDLPYFVPLPIAHNVGHSALGVVGVDAVLSLAIFALWHGVLVAPALAVAPRGLRARLSPGAGRGIRERISGPGRLRLLYAAFVTGAATHVGWDAFTHAGRWGERHIAWLATLHGPRPGYWWAQYASGLGGALVLGITLVRWWRSTAPSHEAGPPSRSTPFVYAGVLGAGALAAAVTVSGVLTTLGAPAPRRLAFAAVTRGGSAAAAVGLVLALGWQVNRRSRHPAVAAHGEWGEDRQDRE